MPFLGLLQSNMRQRGISDTGPVFEQRQVGIPENGLFAFSRYDHM